MVVEERLVTGELPVPFAPKGHVELAEKPTEHPGVQNRGARPRPRTSSGGGTYPAQHPEGMERALHGGVQRRRSVVHDYPMPSSARAAFAREDATTWGLLSLGDHDKVQDSP